MGKVNIKINKFTVQYTVLSLQFFGGNLFLYYKRNLKYFQFT